MSGTDDRLAEIQQRADAATAGPWVHNPRNGIHKPNGHCVATTHSGTSYDDDRVKDAAFIAAAREDIPWLVAELVSLRGQLEAATELAERAAGSRNQVRGATWREFTAILDALGGAQ